MKSDVKQIVAGYINPSFEAQKWMLEQNREEASKIIFNPNSIKARGNSLLISCIENFEGNINKKSVSEEKTFGKKTFTEPYIVNYNSTIQKPVLIQKEEYVESLSQREDDVISFVEVAIENKNDPLQDEVVAEEERPRFKFEDWADDIRVDFTIIGDKNKTVNIDEEEISGMVKIREITFHNPRTDLFGGRISVFSEDIDTSGWNELSVNGIYETLHSEISVGGETLEEIHEIYQNKIKKIQNIYNMSEQEQVNEDMER